MAQRDGLALAGPNHLRRAAVADTAVRGPPAEVVVQLQPALHRPGRSGRPPGHPVRPAVAPAGRRWAGQGRSTEMADDAEEFTTTLATVELPVPPARQPTWLEPLRAALGLVGVLIVAQLLVVNESTIAQRLGVFQVVIGFTLVSLLGTVAGHHDRRPAPPRVRPHRREPVRQRRHRLGPVTPRSSPDPHRGHLAAGHLYGDPTDRACRMAPTSGMCCRGGGQCGLVVPPGEPVSSTVSRYRRCCSSGGWRPIAMRRRRGCRPAGMPRSVRSRPRCRRRRCRAWCLTPSRRDGAPGRFPCPRSA